MKRVDFETVIAACNRAMQTKNLGDSIAAQILLTAYVEQIQRGEHRAANSSN
jgi:hypothetical protein